MIPLNKCHCPSSEDFFYWPPEEIAQYSNWCEIGNSQHKRRIKKIISDKKSKNIKLSNQ